VEVVVTRGVTGGAMEQSSMAEFAWALWSLRRSAAAIVAAAFMKRALPSSGVTGLSGSGIGREEVVEADCDCGCDCGCDCDCDCD